jgi:hypothetical protein
MPRRVDHAGAYDAILLVTAVMLSGIFFARTAYLYGWQFWTWPW